MKNKYFVTGATGFIGANIVRRLVNMGEEVHIIIRKQSNPWRIKDIITRIKVHYGDLQNKDEIERIVENVKPTVIFHLGVYGAYPFQQDVNQMIGTNILGTVNLVNACIRNKFKIFINTGTSSEYGFKREKAAETSWLEPNSYYAVSKASATLYSNYTAKKYELPMVTFRLYSAYGPYEEPTRFVPTLIKTAFKGKLPNLVSPKISRDYIFVEDIVNAYLMAAKAPHKLGIGEIYNIGTGRQTTIKDMVCIVKEMMEIKANPKWNTMTPRIWDTTTWIADINKIKSKLGWRPRYNVKEGLEQTIEWFRHNDTNKVYNMWG